MTIRSKAKQFDLLCETLEKLSQASDADARLRIIMDAIAELGLSGACRSRYAEYIEEEDALAVRCATGDYGRIDPSQLVYRAQPGSSLTGWVFAHNEPLRVDSFDKDLSIPKWKGRYDSSSAPWRTSVESFLAVPVKAGGRVIGVLSVDAQKKNFFGQSQMEAFRPYFILLANALSNTVPRPHEPVMSSVNRHRQRQVLVLGKDTGVELERLHDIATVLRKLNYEPLLVKDHPDIPELSNEEKVRVIADLSRFVVLENSFPAGQIAECKMCATNRIITTALREQGKGSSYMVTDYFRDFDFMREFEYTMSPGTLGDAVFNGTTWAEKKIKDRRKYYDNLYPWRKKK